MMHTALLLLLLRLCPAPPCSLCVAQVQQDELAPRAIESFRGRIVVLADQVVSSAATAHVWRWCNTQMLLQQSCCCKNHTCVMHQSH